MLLRCFPRLILVLVPLLTIGILSIKYSSIKPTTLPLSVRHWIQHPFSTNHTSEGWYNSNAAALTESSSLSNHLPQQPQPQPQTQNSIPSQPADPAPPTHYTLTSLTSPSGAYFPILFSPHSQTGHTGSNPNILPHPTLPDTYIVVAQQQRSTIPNTIWFAELTCLAAFTPPTPENNNTTTLQCLPPGPVTLPIAPTNGGSKCTGSIEYFNRNIGPHDARVFWGPKTPYIIYGSNSFATCFGMWMQDFRMLVDWGYEAENGENSEGEWRGGEMAGRQWSQATELQRPLDGGEWGAVEKNWFLFWDFDGVAYVHHDLSPTQRVFGKLSPSSSLSSLTSSTEQNLAPLAAAAGDSTCLSRLMPQGGDIHQATNSLSVTLCSRGEEGCAPNEDNTFILTIFQQKRVYGFHAVYEPYVLLFRQRAPFEVHAVGRRPFWIRGRKSVADVESVVAKEGGVEEGESEMVYVTSLAWRERGMQYHGFRDDVVFIGFGVEDRAAGGIDVRVGELLAEMEVCGTGSGM